MPTVGEIKDEMKFSTQLGELIDAMKDRAVFGFRSLERRLKNFERYDGFLDYFSQIIDTQNCRHPFVKPGMLGKPAILLITSDEGFMGGLNLKVINTALEKKGAGEAVLYVVGERGARGLEEMGLHHKWYAWSHFKTRENLASAVCSDLLGGMREGNFDRLIAVYSQCQSFMIQRIAVLELLPLTMDPPLMRWRASVGPATNALAGKRGIKDERPEAIMESPVDDMVDYLGECVVLRLLSKMLEQSKLSEYAARAIHLEKSGNDISERNEHLKLEYFRAHHAIIDKGARELFSAQIIRRKA